MDRTPAQQRRDYTDSTCTYQQSVTKICQCLYQDNGWTNPSGSNNGCAWDGGRSWFGWGTAGGQVEVVIRSSADPYVKALELTDGLLNFGNTQAQNATVGAGARTSCCAWLLPWM